MFPLLTCSSASSESLADVLTYLDEKEMTERNTERYEVKSRKYYEAIPKVNLAFRDELGLRNDEAM